MKNRILGMMVAGAALGMAMPPMNAPAQAGLNPLMPKAQGGVTAPQGGIGTLVQAMLGTGGGYGGGPARPNYRRGGYTVAQGKRAARKRRNVLRARGQYRRAVR